MGFDLFGTLFNAAKFAQTTATNAQNVAAKTVTQAVQRTVSAPTQIIRIAQPAVNVVRNVRATVQNTVRDVPRLVTAAPAKYVAPLRTAAVNFVQPKPLPKTNVPLTQSRIISLATPPVSPQLKLGMDIVDKVVVPAKQMVFNEKWGTDYSDMTVDPWGKTIAKFGEEQAWLSKPIRNAYMDAIWNPYKATESVIGQGLRDSPVPGAAETLEVLRFGRDLAGFDNPENSFTTIASLEGVYGAPAKAATKLAKRIPKLAQGADMIGSSIGKTIFKNLDNLKAGVKKIGGATDTKVRQPKIKTPAPRKTTVPRKTTPPKRVEAPRRPTNPRQRIADATPQRAKTGRSPSRTVQTRYTTAVDNTPTKAPISTPKPKSAPTVNVFDDALKRLDDTLKRTDDITRNSDAIMKQQDELAQALARTSDNLPNKPTSSLKAAGYGLAAGAGGAVGTMTLAGLLFPKDAETLTPEEAGGTYPPLDPDGGDDCIGDQDGGQWQTDDSGITQWTPTPDQLEDLPQGIQDDLSNGGSILFDSNGDPWGLADEEGNLIRELTEDEKEAVKALADSKMPWQLKARQFMANNPLLVGGAVVTVLVGGALVYSKYASGKTGVKNHYSSGRKKHQFGF